MQADLDTVARVQGLDIRCAELLKEIAALPRHVAEIEKALHAHQRKLEADKALLAGNQRERKLLEGEIQVQRAKITKLRDQIMSAKTNEQYRAFQHEIEFCESEISRLEDRTLELMLESEVLDKNVTAAEVALAKEKAQVEAEKVEARKRTETDKQQLEAARAERKTLLASVNPQVAGTYERLLKRFQGIAVSDATNGRCATCHLEIRPQMFQDLRRRDKLMTCENCGRILHYNPPSDFDEQLGAPVASGSGSRVDMS